jgi:hypothetical protein
MNLLTSEDGWPSTVQYLKDLAACDSTLPSSICNDASYLFGNLLSAMEKDKTFSAERTYLRPAESYLPTTYYSRRLNGGGNDGKPENLPLNLTMVFVCILCAGFASGLTQGLLSLDFTEMKIKSRSGTPNEKKYANKLIPVIKRHHLLIVTLMLWNASATEALPIFLSGLVPEYLAIVISVTLVLFVGEIIPAAILTGTLLISFTCIHLSTHLFLYGSVKLIGSRSSSQRRLFRFHPISPVTAQVQIS